MIVLSRGMLLHAFVLLAMVQAPSGGSSQQATTQPQVVESGKFLVYVLKSAQAEERYQIEREGETLTLTTQASPLHKPLPWAASAPETTTLRLFRPDLTPRRLTITNGAPSHAETGFDAEINGKNATVTQGASILHVTAPEGAFPISGPASVPLQMMLVRYWVHRGKPSTIPTIPKGNLKFRFRGRDHVEVGGAAVSLERYSVGGLVWGDEDIWLDSSQDLAAIVAPSGGLTGGNWFQGVREGYQQALPLLLSKFAEDGIDRWHEMSRKMSPGNDDVIAIVGATLIDGTGRAPVNDSAVVIRAGRIEAAGPQASVRIPEHAHVVTEKGKFLMPGLWDTHAHLTQAEWGPAYLAAGVTAVRDCGGEFEVVTAFRNASRSKNSLSPNILLAGYMEGNNPYIPWDISVTSVDQVPAPVQHYHDAGFQQIKIRDFVSLDILRALASEAHRSGMTVAGHVPVGISTVEAVEAGQDQISHARFAVHPLFTDWYAVAWPPPKADFESPPFKQAVQVFKQHRTVFDPTLASDELPGCSPGEFCEPGIAKAPPELARRFAPQPPDPNDKDTRREFEQEIEVVGILHRAGLPIVAGTDGGVPGHRLHRELELYVKAGFTPMEAIQSATIVPAKVMNLDKELGTIEAGKRADMILLDANPLEDISNIRTVRTVIASGRVYDSAALWRSVGFKP